MTNKVYVGDVGTKITLDCTTDVSAATTLTIEVLKPDGTSISWVAGKEANNTSISYTTKANDLDIPGVWRMQASVDSPLWVGLGETAKLRVHRVYD